MLDIDKEIDAFSLAPQVECKDGTWQYKRTDIYHSLVHESPTCSPKMHETRQVMLCGPQPYW